MRPAEGFTEAALRDPDPCLQRRDRPHIREHVAHVQALRLVEQLKCAGQVSFSLGYPSHRDPPAILVLRQSVVLAQLLARQQVAGGGMQVVALAVDLAHPYVHVCRSPQNRGALLRRTLQCLLVGAHRLAETTLRKPDVRQRDRAAEYFFSSRRRHTTLQGDWSSDVCSSDLPKPNSMITGTGPLALAGVVNVNSMLTVIAGYAELSTWPTIFLVTTGTSPFFSCVVPLTSQTTLGVTLGTRP